MPPKKDRSTAKAKAEQADVGTSVEAVGVVFQQVHRSAAHAQKCKRELINFALQDQSGTVSAVCAVELLVLRQTPQLTGDALKRHYAFLAEVCRAFREQCNSDELAVAVMRQLLVFHNANDKLVRLAVVTTYEALLKTVDQGNTSEERQDFYQDVAEMLKQRAHDKCPQVREKAVAAVAAFQTGRKNCDVSQQLIALLCCDTNADVRRQVLRSIAPRKEFLEGYFHGMIRCTRDVVVRVRAEAWDALGRFPWRYITAYASAKATKLPELVLQGLTDQSSSVTIACRAALTNCWLHRDCRDECETMLDGIACGYVLPSLTPFHRISDELLAYVQKRTPDKRFKLNVEDVNTSSLLMWRADCKMRCDREGEDETEALLPLEQFAAVLQDAVYAYARPDVPPKTVKFRNIEDADNMLRILLSAFDLYEDNGYLAHADNTTRISLLRLLNFLLKVVPDDDPALFVDVAVRSLKALTRRTPEEATKTVTSALDSLFRSLKLPQRYALGFEDVEALGRKSRERQQDLARLMALLRSGDTTQAEVDELKAEMDRDEKFLLRMQLIVLAFLSHSERGDAIPTFCSHIIQLGRQQDNEKVKVAATKSLGLQCLVSAETVHTFLPLILADALESIDAAGGGEADLESVEASVPVTSVGVIFDLVMEYGFKFFDVVTGPGSADSPSRSQTSPNAAAAGTLRGENGADAAADPLEARLQREQELAEEDIHKVGSKRLLATLLSFLRPGDASGARNVVAITGFCKLLSCNRVVSESVPLVVAELFCHFASLQLRRQESAPGAAVAGYLYQYLDKFFRSYAASHPRRQAFVAEGGVMAFHVLLTRNTAVAARLMDYVTRVSDAFTLTQIREIDPEAAKRVSDNSAAELESAEESEAAAGAAHASSRTAAARSSMQSGRLLRELGRYSLHERIAEALLIELANRASESSLQQRQTCVQLLERRMYFYSKEPQPFLHVCGAQALKALGALTQSGNGEDEELYRRLQTWLDGVAGRHGGNLPASPTVVVGGDATDAAVDEEGLYAKFEVRSRDQLAALQRLTDHGFSAMPDIPREPQCRVTRTAATFPAGGTSAKNVVEEANHGDGRETDRKRERTESIFLDIGVGMGSRRRPRN